MFWDSHAHNINKQKGGFIIALENGDKGVLSNDELRAFKLSGNYIPVEYVTRDFQKTFSSIVKYHPRLEQYTVTEVIADIRKRNPIGVIFDTLNDPYWQPNDYWQIAKEFPKIEFLLSHAGGYKILDFIEICEFNKNVWLDFSFTQNHFGIVGNRTEFKYIAELIKYAVQGPIKERVLFGSDYPYENQEECFEYYSKNVNKEIYTDNFENLLSRLREKGLK